MHNKGSHSSSNSNSSNSGNSSNSMFGTAAQSEVMMVDAELVSPSASMRQQAQSPQSESAMPVAAAVLSMATSCKRRPFLKITSTDENKDTGSSAATSKSASSRPTSRSLASPCCQHLGHPPSKRRYLASHHSSSLASAASSRSEIAASPPASLSSVASPVSQGKSVSAFVSSGTTTPSSPASPFSITLRTRSIGQLYDAAQANFDKGKFPKALEYFRRAIRRHHRNSTSHKSTIADHNATEMSERSASLESSSPAFAVASDDIQPSNYIYQRLEFDEGIQQYFKDTILDIYDVDGAVVTSAPDSSEVTTTLTEAMLYFNAGQACRKCDASDSTQDAMAYHQRALECMQQLEGNVTISKDRFNDILLPILHQMGQISYQRSEVAEAISFYERALFACQSSSTSTSRMASKAERERSIELRGIKAFTLNCLGVMHYHSSSEDSAKTLQYFHAALKQQRKQEQHIQLASQWTHATEAMAGDDSTDVLSLQQNRLHLQQATTMNNLGRVYVQREDFEEALKYYEQALTTRKTMLGADHIDYAATAFNTAQSYHQQGFFHRALYLYHEFLRIARETFPSQNHRDIAVVLSGIAQIYQEQKQHEKALELYNDSLRVGIAALGKFHSEIAMLYNRIGNFHFGRRKFDEALAAYKEGLDIERRVLDATHPNVLVTMSNIAEIHRQRKQYMHSIQLYTQVFKLQQQKYGKTSAEVAETLVIVGLIYDQMNEPNLALKFLQAALIMRRSVFGEDHLTVASTLVYLGTIFYQKSNINLAQQLFTESLRIRRLQLGDKHRDVSFTLYNLALCFQLQGRYDDAINCYRETLRIEKAVLGENHKDVSMTMYKLGEVYQLKEDLSEALQYFEAALEIERSTIGRDDPAVMARTLNEIGNIHMSRGEVGKMMEAFSDSARLFEKAGQSIAESIAVPDKLYAFENTCPLASAAA